MCGHEPGGHTVLLILNSKLTMEGIVKAFLDQGPPWVGDSAFGDKADVKKAGGRWDGASKKWRAIDEPSLIALISDGKWRPAGHDSTFAGEVVRYIRRRDQAAELVEKKKREAASRKSKEPTQVQRKCTARSDLMIPPDEPHLLAEALKHGVDQALVTSTGAFGHLGPRGGISDVSRLFRGIRFGIVTWETLKNGEAARVGQDQAATKKSSATGGGDRRGRGVKRGAGSMGGTSGIFGQIMSTGASNTNDLPHPVKHRKRVKDVVTYRYKVTCDNCNTTLDSREQFGLECMCVDGSSYWYACSRCSMPKREAGHCGPCAQRLEEIKQEEKALNSNS